MNEKDEGEILSRVRRIETRLMRLAEMLGLDPSDKVRAKYNTTINAIEVTGMDVSISNLLDILRREGISNDHLVGVIQDGKLVMMISGGDQ